MSQAKTWVRCAVGLGALLFLACAAAAAPAGSTAADPIESDGDKYHVLLDNALVRVLAYQDEPGTRTHLHRHPCFVLYALQPFERRLTFPDGTQKVRAFHGGEVAWMPAQAHVGENIGKVPTRALLVELKGPCQAGS